MWSRAERSLGCAESRNFELLPASTIARRGLKSVQQVMRVNIGALKLNLFSVTIDAQNFDGPSLITMKTD